MKKLIFVVMILVLLTGCNRSFMRGFARGVSGNTYRPNQNRMFEALVNEQRRKNAQDEYYQRQQAEYNRQALNAIRAEQLRRIGY